eukprot:scpid107045/ scgid13281/ 
MSVNGLSQCTGFFLTRSTVLVCHGGVVLSQHLCSALASFFSTRLNSVAMLHLRSLRSLHKTMFPLLARTPAFSTAAASTSLGSLCISLTDTAMSHPLCQCMRLPVWLCDFHPLLNNVVCCRCWLYFHLLITMLAV